MAAAIARPLFRLWYESHHMNDTVTTSNPSPAEVARLFLTPSRARRVAADFLPEAQRLSFDTSAGQVAAVRAGHGPTVLLVHGWEGQAADLAGFAPPLLAAGFSVVAIDLPAHGASSGERSSIPAAARAVRELQAELGDLHAVIAHSVGSAVTAEALGHGLQAGAVALLSAPAHYLNYARAVASQAGLDAAGTQQMLQLLLAEGVDVASVSLPRRAPGFRLPALFVHSDDDRVVGIGDARESVAAWPGARLLQVEGLGHRRILTDATVIDAVVGFIAGRRD